MALLPVLVLVVTRAGREYLPHGDIALIDLRVRDVFSGDVPLVGPYSRYGWNHPGPAFFYLLAPLDALAGGAAWATLIGSALLQGVATAWASWLAWRRGALLLVLLVLAAVCLATYGIGERLLLDAWNPHVTVPFLATFVLLVWSVAAGARAALVGAVAVGTFLVQTHTGYVPLVGAAAVWLGVTIAIDARRGGAGPWRDWRRPVLLAAGVGVLLWLPPVVEQLTGDPGNLRRLVSFARDGAGDGAGIEAGAGLFGAEFRLLPPWLGGDDLVEPLTNAARPASAWWLLVPVALAVAGLVVARRRRARDAGRLVGMLAVLAAVGVLALANVEPPLEAYLFHWRIVLATLLVAAVAWAALAERAGSDRAVLVAGGVLALALAYGAGGQALAIADHTGPVNISEPATERLLDQLGGRVPDRPFLTRNIGSAYRGIHGALVDELDRDGAPVRVDAAVDHAFGDHRTARPADVETVWYVAEEGRDVSLYSDLPGARVIARTTPLRNGEERELVDLQRRLARQLRDAGREDLVAILEYGPLVRTLRGESGLDDRDVERVAELVEEVERVGGCRCAVIAFAPTDAPPLEGLAAR